MIAQLSQSEPLGSPSSSSIGVRWAGSFSKNSGVVVCPHTSSCTKSCPAARTKIRPVRLLRLGLRTKGMPSTPSQKSIDVCRSAPTIVMWWTPWLWSFRMCSLASVLDELRLVFAATQASERDELHSRLDDEHVTEPLTDRFR